MLKSSETDVYREQIINIFNEKWDSRGMLSKNNLSKPEFDIVIEEMINNYIIALTVYLPASDSEPEIIVEREFMKHPKNWFFHLLADMIPEKYWRIRKALIRYEDSALYVNKTIIHRHICPHIALQPKPHFAFLSQARL